GKNQPPVPRPGARDLAGAPALLVPVGKGEVVLSDSTRLVERARKAGVDATVRIYDHMYHDFQMFGVIVPEARGAIAEIRTFLKKFVK
nr:alpha/beta hydrolase fold domain-containing protein [Spirochaetota bacterium]